VDDSVSLFQAVVATPRTAQKRKERLVNKPILELQHLSLMSHVNLLWRAVLQNSRFGSGSNLQPSRSELNAVVSASCIAGQNVQFA